MATIYSFDVRCVSAFQAYPEDMIQKVIEVKPKKYTFVD